MYRYYTYDMAGHKKYFKTRTEANEWQKFVMDKTAYWLKIYKVSNAKKLGSVLG